jgi:2-hydroxycyclohexanecarboxyl-CoA dehydrogenase
MATPEPRSVTGLAGARVIVTGAGRGIGRAVATRLVADGARVAVLAQHWDSAAAAARELGAAAIPIAGDLANREENHRVMAEAMQALAGVDVLINNAGWTLTTPFLEESPDYWDRVLKVNLYAVIWSTRAVLDEMVRQGSGGAVVNVVSDAGRAGMAGEAVYAAAKGGVVALTKSLAQEMARHQIRLNAVAPGPTHTRVLEDNMAGPNAAARIERMIRRIPLRRVAEPEDIAGLVCFLAGPDASYITGQVMSVSGGLTMF